MTFMDSAVSYSDPQENLKLGRSPIFHISRVLAAFPFEHGKLVRTRHHYAVYGVILLIAFTSYQYNYMEGICATEQSNTNKLLYGGYALLNIIVCTACILTPFANRNSITMILSGFSKADSIIKHVDPKFIFHENQRRQLFQVGFILLSSFWFALTHAKAAETNIFPSFTFLEFYILPLSWIIVFQLDYFLVHMRERYTFVNKQLKNARHDADKDEQTPRTLTIPQLCKLNHIHFTLYEIASSINSAYSVQLLAIIPRVIFFCVLPVHYNVVTGMVKDPNASYAPQTWTHIFTLSQIVLLTAPVIYVVNVASNTVSEAKKVHILIHDLIDEVQEEQTECELLIFSVQLLHRKIEFSVHKFFNLQPSLITAVFELIIMYVIILLQFQNTPSSTSPVRLLLRPRFTPPPTTRHRHRVNITTTPNTTSFIENLTTFATLLFTNLTDISNTSSY